MESESEKERALRIRKKKDGRTDSQKKDYQNMEEIIIIRKEIIRKGNGIKM